MIVDQVVKCFAIMQRARGFCWRGPAAMKDAQQFRREHRYETSQMDFLRSLLEAKVTKDNIALYAKVFSPGDVDRLKSLPNRYNKRTFFLILVFALSLNDLSKSAKKRVLTTVLTIVALSGLYLLAKV